MRWTIPSIPAPPGLVQEVSQKPVRRPLPTAWKELTLRERQAMHTGTISSPQEQWPSIATRFWSIRTRRWPGRHTRSTWKLMRNKKDIGQSIAPLAGIGSEGIRFALTHSLFRSILPDGQSFGKEHLKDRRIERAMNAFKLSAASTWFKLSKPSLYGGSTPTTAEPGSLSDNQIKREEGWRGNTLIL